MGALLMQKRRATRADGAVGVMTMSNDLPVRRLPIRLQGDDRRVILRPFVMSHGRVRTLFERLDGMPEETVRTLLADVTASFADRHVRLMEAFAEHLAIGVELTGWKRAWSTSRQ